MRPKSIKLQKKTGKSLCDIDLGSNFLAMTPTIQAIKAKISKREDIELKNSPQQRKKNQSEKEPYRMETVFANYLSVKGLIFKIYKG